MKVQKSRLVWKLNGVILLILVVVLGISEYLTSRAYRRDALASAREVSGLISRTLVQSVRESMMTRDTAEMEDLFDRLTEDNPDFQNIRLVAHGGRVVVPTHESDQTNLDRQSWPCSTCHGPPEVRRDSVGGTWDRVSESEGGGRIVSVVTSIHREGGCETSGCHTGLTSTPILGFLQTEHSLRAWDDRLASRVLYSSLTLLASLVLCIGATWMIVDRMVGRRIRTLRAGAERVAGKDLDFRFGDSRGDGIAQMTGTFDDMVSELSQTLSELTNTKEYLQGIVENSADIIITVDPAGLIKTFNKGAEVVLGFERGDVVGKRIETLFAYPAERDVAIAQLRHTDHVVNYETHFLTKGGEVRDVILTLSRLRTPAGAPVGTFGISKDVTEKKRLQHELIMKERLAAVGEAVAGIHHTLKNMLGSLKGGSYMLNLGLEEDNRDLIGRGWAMVQDGIGHVTDLSTRTLQYVKDWQPQMEEVSLGDLVESVTDSLREMAESRGVRLLTSVTPANPKILCDPRLIRSALMDLVINAFDACEWKDYLDGDQPQVSVRADWAADMGQVVLEVKDNGHGMTDEVQGRIFNPFFSTKTSTGTGMGLALAARTTRVHGGTLEVESEENRGSTLRIRIPADLRPEQKEESYAEESPGD